MISSEEEFLLLAKRWQAESRTLVVLGSINGNFACFHVRGYIHYINEPERVISITSDPEHKTWAVINYTSCGFGFDTSDDTENELAQMRETLPENERFDETIGIVSPGGACVWVLSVVA